MNKGIISEIKLQFSDIKKGDILTNKFSGTKYTVVEPGDKSITIQQGDDGKEVEVASLNNYELLNEANTDGLKQMGYSDSDIEDFMDEWKQGGSKLPKKVKDYLDGLYNTKLGQLKTKSLREAKDPSATGYFNQDGKEQYSKFDELDKMNAQEIMAGNVMEKQDNPDIDKKEAVKLVIKNLKKDQFYYTNYKLTGIRGLQPIEFTSTKRKSEFDEMEEVNKNGDNFVDDKNKMVVIKEAKLEDVKGLLSDETLRDSDIGYGADNDVSITYKSYKELPFDDLFKLQNKYQVYEDILSSEDEPTTVQYFISDKFNSTTPAKSEPSKSSSDEDVFENKSNVKAKLKEVIRKMMKEMFDGRNNIDATNDIPKTDNVSDEEFAKMIKKYYAPVEKPDEKFLLSTLYSNGEATIKNVGGTVYYDYPGSFMKDLRSGKIKEVPFY